MSLQRLCGRFTRLEAQQRPWVVADILRRTRQCASGELGAFLMDALTSVDQATATAIMDHLTDAELAVLIGPEAGPFMDTLPDSELEALTRGDAAAIKGLQRSCHHWRHGPA